MFKGKKETMLFKLSEEGDKKIVEIIGKVYKALDEKDYEPKNQIIGYILSGDPSYITSHGDARKLMRQIDRNELIEELLTFYLDSHDIK